MYTKRLKTSEEVRALQLAYKRKVSQDKLRRCTRTSDCDGDGSFGGQSDMTEMQKQTRNLKLALRESVADARQTYDETEEMVDDITDWLGTKAQERKEEQQKSSEPRKPPKRIVPA